MTNRVLLIGYGNPGRLDDGLGPACAEAVERLRLPGVDVDSDYQLTVEDAERIAAHDIVVFADASVNGPEPFGFTQVLPCADVSFSTHSVEPEAALAMAHDLFESKAKGFALAIRGYEFNEFGERLSDAARHNLDAAVAFIAKVIREQEFDRYAQTAGKGESGKTRVFMDLTPEDMN